VSCAAHAWNDFAKLWHDYLHLWKNWTTKMTHLEKQSPVIVLGMHRSGTSILSKLVSELGVGMGFPRNGHFEDQRIKALNKRIMAVCHANWDFPVGCRALYENHDFQELVSQKVSQDMKFHLPDIWLRRRSWGWKDPRTLATLPVWTRLFPNARTITVVRSATEVSKSLVKRERNRSTFLASAARGLGSIRCTSSAGALALIEEYSWFTENNKSFGLSERKLEISYSEMIDNPLETVLKLQSFLEINLPRRRTIEISGLIEPR
jgi:hypothetical protein